MDVLRIKKYIKLVVRFIEKIIPKSMFEPCFQAAFKIYKGTIRFLYLFLGFFRYGLFNSEQWRTVKKIHAVMPYSYVGIKRLKVTYELGKQLRKDKVAGDFVELGVARGGCAALLAAAMCEEIEGVENDDERKLWLFDSYEGLPDPTVDDFDSQAGEGTGDHITSLEKGDCKGTIDEVKHLMFSVNNFPKDRIEFVKGWFQDTIPVEGENIPKIALLRIDGDWYESTKCCLEGLYDRVATGGYVVVDDYLFCYGCYKAVNEFFETRKVHHEIHLDGGGGCYIQKA